MAFYPDELSPIDRLTTLQKANDLSDINLLKNRRQWKNLILGKKEMGLNNFATITEEKEDEISSDESQGGKKLNSNFVKSTSEGSAKKITFPKPRKYITPRISDKFNNSEGVGSSPPLIKSYTENANAEYENDSSNKREIAYELRPQPLNSYRENKNSDPKLTSKSKKSREGEAPKKEIIEHYVLSGIPSESQWNKVSEAVCLTGWPKMKTDKDGSSKQDSVQAPKPKAQEKKKTGAVNIKLSVGIDKGKFDNKVVKRKTSKKGKNLKPSNEKEETSGKPRLSINKIKTKIEKDKSLNMKEVVNMYKNLAYGSKDEIKSFVEKLSFIKDDSENDKNLLSVMNLKALEYKIKNFGKMGGISHETSMPEEKKLKVHKNVRKSRKAHIEKLARHKIVKVPVVTNAHYVNTPQSHSIINEKKFEQKGKKQIVEDKEPWKYVGVNSVLDKAYIVYPAYQPSSSPTKKKRIVKRAAVGAGEDKSKKDDANPVKSKSLNLSQQRPKVKHPEVVIRSKAGRDYKSRSRTISSANALSVCRSMSDKRLNRFSATTVCTVKFRPSLTQATHNMFPLNESEPTDPSLLVYLHGSKAVNIKTPYSDRQSSRVKFFRNNERGIPLIKGLSRKGLTPNYQNFPIKKISLPDKFSSFRPLDLLDFDEDIQNITDFLHSQTNPNPEHPEGSRSPRKRRRPRPIEWPKEECPGGVPTQIRLNRQIRSQDRHHDSCHHHHQNPRHSLVNSYHHHHHHHHQHGTEPEALSPDSFFNEISKHIQQLQFLPDTKESRKLISQFFEELDNHIEESKDGQLFLQRLPSFDYSHCPIPLLGY